MEGKMENIILASSFHIAESEDLGDNDSYYMISFRVNDAFKEAKSHSGEMDMLYTYTPGAEYGKEGSLPYLAIQMDDEVYCAVEEFKEHGAASGVMEMTVLQDSPTFYFKAKVNYRGYMMYFYGLDRCDGFWKNNGLCIVYPKAYVGTENETKLMKVLDEAAESYHEEKIRS